VESGEIEDNDDHWQRETSGGEDFYVTATENINEDNDHHEIGGSE
jgi:hypothetical protein